TREGGPDGSGDGETRSGPGADDGNEGDGAEAIGEGSLPFTGLTLAALALAGLLLAAGGRTLRGRAS
ncbi:MAG: hypothetical protein ACRDL4_15580, partial [Thermoleophilaceae bacterium]